MSFSFPPNSALPKYVQAIRWLEDALKRGDFKPGDQLPGESALAKRFNVSTITIRQAFQELTRQGRLIRYPYRGTFVTPAIASENQPAHHADLIRSRLPHKRILVLAAYCDSKETIAIPRTLGKGRQDQILEAFEKEVSRHGFHCQIKRLIRHDTRQELSAGEIAKYDAAFLLADTLSLEEQTNCVHDLTNAKIPFIVSDYFGTAPAHRIQESLAQGVEAALSHFASLGHSRIGLLTFETLPHWGEEWPWLQARRDAFLHSARRRGWKKPEQRIWSVSLPKLKKGQYVSLIQETAGERLVEQFLRNGGQQQCTALLAINDRVAMGFQTGLSKHCAKRLPLFSYIGFDNEIAAQSVGLTTVASPAQEMGIGAAAMLFELMNAPHSRNMRSLEFAPCLLCRASTEPVKPDAKIK
ncbi:MAG: hypothetical protein B9S32_05770 [Verrucomicrobia bacterium Tous-C9LFEB]|nr:MAG: hypothetical protein B9S32_05770 [Verrucomicrobia bacterium Tous-C9LFEB]